MTNEFNYSVFNGTMTIYVGNRTLADISECDNMTPQDLDNLADEVLVDKGLIKDNYFTKR